MNIKKLKEMRKNKKGFTLFEIIVVIVILAVLLAVAVPSVLNYINEADSAKLMANSRAVMNAAQAEVVKEVVTSDGLTGDELDAVIDKVKLNSGVNVNDIQLYTGNVTVDDETAVAAGTLINKAYLDQTAGDVGSTTYPNRKPELKAVTMTLDGKKVTAVINDKIYVEK